MLIAVLYFVQRGVRHGIYSSVTYFCALALAAAIGLNYYEGFARYMVANWSFTEENARAMALLLLFGGFGILFIFPVLRYFSATAPMQKILDRILGGVFGLLLGVTILGMFFMVWFNSELSGHPSLAFDSERIWPRRPDSLLAEGFAILSRHGGGAEFQPGSIIKARAGFQMPTLVTGFWINSIPPGLRVFIRTTRTDAPLFFRNELSEMLRFRDEELKKRRGASGGFMGRTGSDGLRIPLQDDRGVDIHNMLVAVEITVPRKLAEGLAGGASPYEKDGEVMVFTQKVGDELRLVKIYELRRERGVDFFPFIALFYPKNATAEEIEKMLPVREVCKVDEDAVRARLHDAGVAEDEIDGLIQRFKRAGKIVFRARAGWQAMQATRKPDQPMMYPIVRD